MHFQTTLLSGVNIYAPNIFIKYTNSLFLVNFHAYIKKQNIPEHWIILSSFIYDKSTLEKINKTFF